MNYGREHVLIICSHAFTRIYMYNYKVNASPKSLSTR
jgi:hypothetical protein